ncbi:ester cyclase [Haloactinomyces albus]|uniref:SnoaL-like polyketide cyclase n=1 Tax=Haloactinomyces albus TaxID=1352928 RepID=A0AAE4CNB7_9ACTN|nr:ester cyclase [Haloactinomyces albus]MDR7300493.1 hypothetical protein [Haloactinomyces albus]
MPDDELRTLYRKWLPDLWNAEPDSMSGLAADIFAPDAVAHWREGDDHHGPAEIAAQVRQGVLLFDDVVVTLDHGPIVDGELVAAQWTFRGRVKPGWEDVPAAPGTPVRYRGMDLLRASGGRFVEYWPFGDNLNLMTQLGALGT